MVAPGSSRLNCVSEETNKLKELTTWQVCSRGQLDNILNADDFDGLREVAYKAG